MTKVEKLKEVYLLLYSAFEDYYNSKYWKPLKENKDLRVQNSIKLFKERCKGGKYAGGRSN